ncbi:hypothetical protein [Tateyamaria sp. SN6-1]|uniref:hypothetical protein n=1 Tax=Tateyamaria sp. SN6-1 TaxID=3092148 RepID=UPI0039F57A14
MIRSIVLLLAVLGSLPAMAQERITPAQFLDRLAGKTATFVDFRSGDLIGIEQFVRRDRTIWARANGSCAYGTVFVRDGMVCFDYDDQPPGITHCWVPFTHEDGLLVATADGRSIQRVSSIVDGPVICEAPPIS